MPPHERLQSQMALLERLNAVGQGAPSLDEKCRIAEMLRMGLPEWGPRLDRMLLGDRDRLHAGLQEAQTSLGELKQLLDKLTSPPWHVGVYVCGVDGDPSGPQNRVLVHHGGGHRVVTLADGLDPASLALGDEVFLSSELTVLLGKSPQGLFRVGETAAFDRYTADGRLVLKWRDDELVVDAAGPLQSVKLESGDRVRWDRPAWIAYEKLERAAAQRWLLGEVPKGQFSQVGGQRHSLEMLKGALQVIVNPETAALYQVNGRHSALMVGPPGNGKTLIARVVCAYFSETTGRQCRFAVVKPGEWEDPYVGVTQQNMRNCFQALAEAAHETGLAVLFLDEIETIGRVRGSAVGYHNDKFLGALFTELDGFSDRGGIYVIAATNRKDLCDPGLLSRFEMEIPVNRPDMRGAREIFEIHLPESMPFSPNGDAAAATRGQLAQRAVSRLYGPNAENEVCVIKFRDGKTRTLAAHELLSGRMIEQMCRAARHAAFFRDVRTKDRGLRIEDIDEAVSDGIQRLSTLLTPRNAHAYLADLPQDIDVVAVEPIVRRVRHVHRYLNIAGKEQVNP